MVQNDKSDLREEALNILKKAFELAIKEEKDNEIHEAIDDAFIEEIFDCAWNRQFSDDPTKFMKEIRKIIRDTSRIDDEN